VSDRPRRAIKDIKTFIRAMRIIATACRQPKPDAGPEDGPAYAEDAAT